jgi:hypothetical protein
MNADGTLSVTCDGDCVNFPSFATEAEAAEAWNKENPLPWYMQKKVAEAEKEGA